MRCCSGDGVGGGCERLVVLGTVRSCGDDDVEKSWWWLS